MAVPELDIHTLCPGEILMRAIMEPIYTIKQLCKLGQLTQMCLLIYTEYGVKYQYLPKDLCLLYVYSGKGWHINETNLISCLAEYITKIKESINANCCIYNNHNHASHQAHSPVSDIMQRILYPFFPRNNKINVYCCYINEDN